MASGRLSSLHQFVCEVRGKVKKTDISQPSRDFKYGKMLLYRLGKSSSFSIGIQTDSRLPLSTIDLKTHQFEVHARQKRMTISFKNSTARFSVVEADEAELKRLVEMLKRINCNSQDKKARLKQNITMSTSLLHNEDQYNDENQPLNICTEKSQIASSNETNQFLSSSPPTQIKTKRKCTPLISGTASSFYGSRNTDSPVKRMALSPKIDRSSLSSSSTKENMPKRTVSSPLERKKIVGLSKDFKRKPTISRFLFKPSSQPSFTDDLQLTGFSNLGNTCYMNAILQSLLGIQPFVQDLCNKSLLVKHPAQSLYKCTHGLLVCKKKNCPQDLQSLHLRKFKRAISKAATRFSGHLQHDAHEFLCQVLDQLKDEVASLSNKESTEGSPICTDTEKDFTQSCPVTRTFECAVSHTITCKGCGQNVTKEEILHDLSLDLPTISNESTFHSMKGIPIDKLIEDYFKDEELEYCCEECGFKEACISHKFSKLPRVLILHVKRYDFNKLTDRHAKKHNVINIKKFIDIGKLCADKTSPPLHFEVQTVQLTDAKSPVVDVSETFEPSYNSTTTTPSARRQLNQEFKTTPKRKKSIEADDEGKESQHQMNEKVQVTVNNLDCISGSQRNVQVITNPVDSIMEDFEDIDKTPLQIESSENTKELLSMPEDQQLEWALRESLKTRSERKDQSESDECEYDMDCTDEEILSALTDNYCQQPVGLKGGARSDADEQSDDSEQSGIVPSSKPVMVLSDDSTETSANEDGAKKRKDSSLCSLIDQQPILNEFVDDLLIEVDTNTGSAKMTDSSQRKNKFVKTVSSPFNAKYRPGLLTKTSQSAQKSSVRTPSPRTYSKSRLHKLSQSEQPKSRKSLYSKPKESSDYEDDLAKAIQKSLEDQEVQSEDDEQMRRAIQLSIQETKIYTEDCLSMEHFKSHASPEKLVPDSLDSGFQSDDGMTFPYRLVSVVSHLGSKSSAGHYISDVYDCSKDEWTSYDDLTAIKVDEYNVRYGHARDGYIFFYMYKNCVNTVQNSKSVTT